MLFWKIRYFDRDEKIFKDRYLYLNTSTLDPVTRAAVEFIAEEESSRHGRKWLSYRHLFVEHEAGSFPGNPNEFHEHIGVGPMEYFEDETGKEITYQEMGPLLTGDPKAVMFRAGTKQHDAELMLAEPAPVPMAEVSLSATEVRLLAYFCRDLAELEDSAFTKEGPGTWSPNRKPSLKTAVTDDEIRSAVTIFRRLYMTSENDPANFSKIVPSFVKAMKGHAIGNWVEAAYQEYQTELQSPPDPRPFIQPDTCTFTRKRLIDVFLYTQYAHQPDETRQRQYNECLTALKGNREALTWLFFTEMWKCGIHIRNVGRFISKWFNAYCAEHGITPDVLASLRDDHAGLGLLEKKESRRARLFGQKVENLAIDLWKQHGQPEGGSARFLKMAHEQLNAMLDRSVGN